MVFLQWVLRSLVAKTAGLVALVAVTLVLVLQVFGRDLVLDRFMLLEQEEAKRRVQLITSQLDSEVDQLRVVGTEMARRDTSRQFLEQRDPIAVAKTLPAILFREQRLNLLLFVDAQGRPAHSQFYDLTKQTTAAPDEAVLRAIQALPQLNHCPDDAQGKETHGGLMLTAAGPWLVASAPIRAHQDRGNCHGRLLVARQLDQEMVRRLSALIGHPLRFEPILPGQPLAPGITTSIFDDQHLVATTTLKDLGGQAALHLSLPMPRSLAQAGEQLWQRSMVAACLLVLAVVGALVAVLQYSVRHRLIRMTREVETIGASDQGQAICTAPGQDELAGLGQAISRRLAGFCHNHREQEEKEHYLQRMLDTITCGVVVVDVATRQLVTVNKASARILDREPEQMIGQTCHASICTSDCNRCPVLDLHETMNLRERVMIRGDGSLVPVLKSATVLNTGERSVLVESFVDISALKEIEAKLLASESRYRQFFEQDLTGDFIETLTGEIVDCNLAFAEMLGYDEVESAKQVNIVDHYPRPQDREKMIERVRRNGKVERYMLELRRRDGSALHCIANEIGEYDELGELVRLRGYFFDETKRVLLEREIRQSQKLEAIGTLASGITHDFNNILADIIGYADLLLMREEEGRRREYLENILTAGEKARKLIHQILTFSKSPDKATLQPLELAPVIREVLERLRATLPATIAIEERLDEKSWVLADPGEIHQIVLNLATNAGHAMRHHGGRLTVHLTHVHPGQEPGAPQLAGQSQGASACLQVNDTGHGIAEAIRDRIFDPFFSTKDKSEGTGLGLSVVQGIVQSLGGSIQLQSTVGQGTSFTILLPLTEGSEAAVLSGATTLATGQEHIAYVDDDSFLVEIGKEILLSLGYQVRTFTDSQKALDYLSEHVGEIDLVVSDMSMPHLTGIGLARGLREAGISTPVIIYTGYVEDLAGEDLAALGIHEVLLKPITPQILAGKVRAVLDRQQVTASA